MAPSSHVTRRSDAFEALSPAVRTSASARSLVTSRPRAPTVPGSPRAVQAAREGTVRRWRHHGRAAWRATRRGRRRLAAVAGRPRSVLSLGEYLVAFVGQASATRVYSHGPLSADREVGGREGDVRPRSVTGFTRPDTYIESRLRRAWSADRGCTRWAQPMHLRSVARRRAEPGRRGALVPQLCLRMWNLVSASRGWGGGYEALSLEEQIGVDPPRRGEDPTSRDADAWCVAHATPFTAGRRHAGSRGTTCGYD